jgi:predicted PurR-regulated permease PerM
VTMILLIVILPLTVVGSLVIREAAGVYRKIESREFDLEHFFRRALEALPTWAAGMLDRFGLTNLSAVQERLSTELARGSQFIATQAINIGQNAFDFVLSFFVVLYLLFSSCCATGTRLPRASGTRSRCIPSSGRCSSAGSPQSYEPR